MLERQSFLLTKRQWVDRESGVAATYFSQLMPTGDPKSIELFMELEREVYKSL